MTEEPFNPFFLGGCTADEYFCDRRNETAELITALRNGRNVTLISPRRMGKTGLIEHCFRSREIVRNCHSFFVDIYATGNLREFIFILGKHIFEAHKSRGAKFLDDFFKIVSSLRAAFKLDPATGAPTFEIGVGDIRQPEYTLEQIFAWLEAADKPCIVAIDEFQQIAKYPEKNVEAALRTHIQRCKKTAFVFAGSQRHMMENIFFSAARPFYQSASLLYLEAIPLKEYADFVQRHFKKADKTISKEVVERVYTIFEGHTWYIQNIFHRLFTMVAPGGTATLQLAENCLRGTVNSYRKLFQETLMLLSERQRELLYAVAKEGKATEITSGAFVSRHALVSPSSVQTSARQLLGKEVLTNEGGSLMIYDRFLGLWLAQEYGMGYRF